MRTRFCKASFTSQAVCCRNGSVAFSDNPNVYEWVIHPLGMAHFPDNHMLSGDNLALYRGNKSTHHLVVSLQAFVAFELLLGVVAGFQN